MTLATGAKIWVEDNEQAWMKAEVVEVDGHSVIARLEKDKTLVLSPASRVHPREVETVPGGVDDMINLAYLHEPAVVCNLASRYELSKIYTYTGNILIAVNPFKKLPHLYDACMMEQYRGAVIGRLSPHVFAIADTAYRAMINENRSQSILVSGESGAGKTETTKLIMQYLAYAGGRALNSNSVEQQVVESNPLLEAFGNAKTVRNDNSSRFGKFVEIQFNTVGRISGAAIKTYLLERSRVVNITRSERNYHCFYQLCASAEDAIKYKLTDPKDFHYLNQSDCFTLSGIDEQKEYMRTRRAMDIVGISFTEQEAIFRTLAAILHLGNVEFIPGKEHDSSILKDEASLVHLQAAAESLMCDSNSLKKALCTRTIPTPEGNIIKMLDPESASINRDTLAKTIYTQLFDWLVEKINKSMGQDAASRVQIGVLDIYGFESFQINSFEQFCINFANEKLQQQFNEHVLRMEQEEYNKEDIDWSYIEFKDNQDVLDLIEKKPLGVIALLDEACMFPKSTGETLSANLFHTLKNNARLKKPKLSSTEFTISHYAGEVTYQADIFVEKNKDYVVVEHEELLLSSKDPFISGLLTFQNNQNRSCYKFSSVASRFKQQLQALVETLSMTEPHYIRCVKPNSNNRPGQFETQSVIHQLRCGGVLEAVRISCAGYPARKNYSEFLGRFGFLSPNLVQVRSNKLKTTQNLLKALGIKNYQLGISKVFLKVGEMAKLNDLRAKALDKSVRTIQARFRTYKAQKSFTAMRSAAIIIQAHWRGHLDCCLFRRKREEAAATLIKAVIQTNDCQENQLKMLQAALHEKDQQLEIAKLLILKEKEANKALSLQLPTLSEEKLLLEATKQNNVELTKEIAHLKIQTNDSQENELKKLQAALHEKDQQLKMAKFVILKTKEANKALSLQLPTLNGQKLLLEAAKVNNVELTKEIAHLKAQREDRQENQLTRLQAVLHEKEQQLELATLQILKENEMSRAVALHLNIFNEDKLLLEATKAKNIMLTNEIERLKNLVHLHESKALEAEKKLIQAREEIAERFLKNEKIESRMEEVHMSLKRLEEKMLFLEIENQALRRKTLASAPTIVNEISITGLLKASKLP